MAQIDPRTQGYLLARSKNGFAPRVAEKRHDEVERLLGCRAGTNRHLIFCCQRTAFDGATPHPRISKQNPVARAVEILARVKRAGANFYFARIERLNAPATTTRALSLRTIALRSARVSFRPWFPLSRAGARRSVPDSPSRLNFRDTWSVFIMLLARQKISANFNPLEYFARPKISARGSSMYVFPRRLEVNRVGGTSSTLRSTITPVSRPDPPAPWTPLSRELERECCIQLESEFLLLRRVGFVDMSLTTPPLQRFVSRSPSLS